MIPKSGWIEIRRTPLKEVLGTLYESLFRLFTWALKENYTGTQLKQVLTVTREPKEEKKQQQQQRTPRLQFPYQD